jgi:predicted HicB family RNase H-like nuclease
MRKKLSIGLRPGTVRDAEEWVNERPDDEQKPVEDVSLKRLTIDIPENLHRKLKVKAATEGVRMADLVRAWITENCS